MLVFKFLGIDRGIWSIGDRIKITSTSVHDVLLCHLCILLTLLELLDLLLSPIFELGCPLVEAALKGGSWGGPVDVFYDGLAYLGQQKNKAGFLSI